MAGIRARVQFQARLEHGGVQQAGRWFFDRTRVRATVDGLVRRKMERFGGAVRTDARYSIRKRQAPSQPGEPPHSHTGLLKDFIFYAWDAASRSVVIGPVPTNQVFFDGNGQPVRGTVPQVLEHGGQITILEVLRHFRYVKTGRGGNRHYARQEGDFWVRADLRSRRRLAERRTRRRTITIEARPYMGPAFDRQINRFADLWSAGDSPGLAASA